MNTWTIIGAVLAFILITVYLAVGALVAHNLTRARRKSPHADPAWDEHTLDRVFFLSRGGRLQLVGWYFRAAYKSRAVVLVHGKDSCRGDEFLASSRALVQSLVERGLSVFLLDLRGHGESESARVTYGLNEREDVLGAVDWLMERGYVPGSIGLLGASMGGACAIAAARAECAVGAVVTDSLFADFNEMMQLKFRKLSGLPRLFLPCGIFFARIFTGRNFAHNRPVDEVRQLASCPLLFIHANQDPFVPSHNAAALAKAAKAGGAGSADVWMTDGAHHLDSYRRQPEQYMKRVGGFFDQHLISGV